MSDTAVERAERVSRERASKLNSEAPAQVGIGRPSAYNPSYCDVVVRLGADGYSKARMAAHIGVAKQTIDNWAKAHPDFLDALTRANTLSQAWWEQEAQNGLKNREFNAGIWDKSVKSMFRDDYTERTINEHVGKDDGPIEIKDDLSAARKIAFMLGRAVGKQQARKADEPQS